jgi:sulfite exporter TauE/SafE
LPSILDLMAMVGLGFFGTGHCVGMCGPIVLAVPARAGRFLPQLTYHAGRVITYTVIGGLVGLVGSGFTWAGGSAPAALHHASDAPLGNLARAQILLSVVAALFLALFAALRIGLVREPRWMRGPSPTRLPGYDRVSKGAVQGRPMAMLLWGMMLGTLPCGLSYAAFARALPAGSAVRGGVLAPLASAPCRGSSSWVR